MRLLENGCAGFPPPLTAKDEDIKKRGLVLILKKLHEEIDRLTVDATADRTTLPTRRSSPGSSRPTPSGRRRRRQGLRPEYQIPRFGKTVAARTGELDLTETFVPIDPGLPAFRADPGEATLAVEAMLASAGKPMAAAEIARGFMRGGKRVEQKVVKALDTLARYGRVSLASDERYIVRRSA